MKEPKDMTHEELMAEARKSYDVTTIRKGTMEELASRFEAVLKVNADMQRGLEVALERARSAESELKVPCDHELEESKHRLRLHAELEAALERERKDLEAFRYLSKGAQFGVSVTNVCKERLAAREKKR